MKMTIPRALGTIVLLFLLAGVVTTNSERSHDRRGLRGANELYTYKQQPHVTSLVQYEEVNLEEGALEPLVAAEGPAVFYGSVWYDSNANSKIDKGEEGVGCATVGLFRKTAFSDPKAILVISRNVDSKGHFEIKLNKIKDGKYYLKFAHKNADSYSFAPMVKGGDSGIKNTEKGKSEKLTVQYGKRYEVNAGLIASAIFKGRFYYDENANGKFDKGEEGVEGGTIQLMRKTTSDGKTKYVRVKTAEALTSGKFELKLNKIKDGKYYLKFAHKNADSFSFAPMVKGGDSGIKNTEKGKSEELTVQYGKRYEVNAGLIAPAIFKGRFYYDENANGKFDKGEEGVEGGTIQLMRKKTSGGKTKYVRVKTAATTSGQFELKLNKIKDGKYCLKFVHDETDLYTFAPMMKGGDSGISDTVRGNSKTMAVEFGRSYEVNAGLVTIQEPMGIHTVLIPTPAGILPSGGAVEYEVMVSADARVVLDTLTFESGLRDTDKSGDLNGKGDCLLPQNVYPGSPYSCKFSTRLWGRPGDKISDYVTASAVDSNDLRSSKTAGAIVTIDTNIHAALIPYSLTIDEPGGAVEFEFYVFADGHVVLDSLTSEEFGNLDGQGDCSLPQTIEVGSGSSCKFFSDISGSAGDEITASVTVSGFDNNGFRSSESVSATVTVVARRIIEDVTITPEAACSGQPVTIKVQATSGTRVRIDGVGGSARVMQFNTRPGELPVLIAAVDPSGYHSERTVWVTIRDCGGATLDESLEPLIGSSLSSVRTSNVHLFVRNVEVFGSGASFKWTVDGKEIGDTTTGVLVHDFSKELLSRGVEASFTVGVTVVGGPRNGAFGSKTVSLLNSYGFFIERGEVRLPTTVRAVDESDTITVSISIENPEELDAILTAEHIGFKNCDPDKPTNYQERPAVMLVVPARGDLAHNVAISLPANICAIEVSWRGTVSSGVSVRASVSAPLPSALVNADVVRLTDPSTVKELNELIAKGIIPATGIFGTELDALFLEGVLSKMPNTKGLPTFLPKRAAGEQKLGDVCFPGDLPPRPGYVCVPTGQLDWSNSRVTNAQKGDLLLSRSCGMLGGLMSAFSSDQHYSHVGIFVTNGGLVRHSLTEEERIEDYPHGIFGKHFDGVQEHALKYIFPGTITSSIDDILNGKELVDNDGHSYSVKGFRPHAVNCDQELVNQLVVKPPPEHDAEVRPLLHAAADAALNINGHYRLFAYTDGRIINNPAYVAPPDATTSWDVAGTLPTMCSLLVWKVLKDVGAILNPWRDVNNAFAEYTDDAPDGMFFYNEGMRSIAAHWLYNYMYKKAKSKDFLGIGEKIFNFPEKIANQITNCFVSDSCGESAEESKAWMNPGSGITVSPSNILYWDSPEHGGVYGYSEQARFTESYITVEHAWKADIATGTVAGTVVGKDGSPISGASVSIATISERVFTGPDGRFVFYAVPEGMTLIDVSGLINEQPAFAQSAQGVTASKTTDATIILRLKTRRVTIGGPMRVKDDEFFGDDFFDRFINVALDVDPDEPDQKKSSQTVKYRLGGEIRVKLTFTAETNENDLSVLVTAKQTLYEGVTTSTNDKEDVDSFQVRVNEDSYEEGQLDTFNSGLWSGDYVRTRLLIVNGDRDQRARSNISATGTLYVRDDDFFGDDKSTLKIKDSFTLSNYERSHVQKWRECADEVRGEIDAYFLLLPNDSVAIRSFHRFYEGTNCKTKDLEDATTWDSVIPVEDPVVLKVHLSGPTKDDRSKAVISFLNIRLPLL